MALLASTVTKSPREPPEAMTVWADVARFTSTTVPPLVLTKRFPATGPLPRAMPSGQPEIVPESKTMALVVMSKPSARPPVAA